MLSADYYLPSYGGECLSGSVERPCKGEIFEYESYLEDEIRILRSRMEQLFDQENSFTSENVIAISGLLDLKINEYMKWRKRKN
ncbi:hypothetical protein GCM10010912_19260 [Paenibacillus albidus]|uniref:Aspartyl-phosphate phosphatase Spo0E family protein n=1 Tax=Paenibacillus albidus TaxID=2041023 RepID=A0A917FDX7_9BACL|nr:hypothetical protein GCM10010912_19260 [Paenibacillus albidus]